MLFLLYFICVLGWFFYVIFLPAYLFENYRFNQGALGDHMGYLALSFSVGSLSIHYLQRKRLVQKKIHVMIFLSIACIAVYLTSFHLPKNWLWLFIGLSGLFVASWWGTFLTYMKQKTDRYLQVKVFELASSLWSVSLIIAPLLAGFILVHGAKYPIVLSSVFLFIGVIIQSIFSIGKNKKNSPDA